MSGREFNLKVEMTPAEAWALAQFVKRVGWQEVRANAVSDDDAYTMRQALEKVREALNREGYSVR